MLLQKNKKNEKERCPTLGTLFLSLVFLNNLVGQDFESRGDYGLNWIYI